MKIEHNVPLVYLNEGSKHTKIFEEFYGMNYDNTKIEYDTVAEAIMASKKMCDYRTRKQIFDVTIRRRKNILYLIRERQMGE